MIEGINQQATISPQEFYYTDTELAVLRAERISEMISHGYPEELGLTSDQYHQRFVLNNNSKIPKGAMIALIETGISFARQLELQDIKLDPAILYHPKKVLGQIPYITWVDVMSDAARESRLMIEAVSTKKRIEDLSYHLRPATPLEAAGAGFENILKHGFAVLAGGEVEPTPGLYTDTANPPRRLTIERFLGSPRLTQTHVDLYDPLLGLLVAHC